MFRLDDITRSNIKTLVAYSSARDEFNGEASIFLDANENSLGSVLNGYHRYPDPLQKQVKQAVAGLKGVDTAQVFLGNGSDECIDLVYRCFAEPGLDNAIICPPTYGMYEVGAAINGVEVKKVPLSAAFEPDAEAILAACNENTKLIWICSPNNPTGNLVKNETIEKLLSRFRGIVVVDEAYIDFSGEGGSLELLTKYPNLVVLQTFSKAWGLAGLRLGMAFASPGIVRVMNKVKPPYNINEVTQELALQAIAAEAEVRRRVEAIVAERKRLEEALLNIAVVQRVFPSEANFLLVKFDCSTALYNYLLERGIVVRDRSNQPGCGSCLRITVGTESENQALIKAITAFSNRKA